MLRSGRVRFVDSRPYDAGAAHRFFCDAGCCDGRGADLASCGSLCEHEKALAPFGNSIFDSSNGNGSVHSRVSSRQSAKIPSNELETVQVVPAWGRCFQKVQRLDHSNARQQLCSCWMWCDLPLLHPRPFRERPERYCSNHHAERHQQLVGSNLWLAVCQ